MLCKRQLVADAQLSVCSAMPSIIVVIHIADPFLFLLLPDLLHYQPLVVVKLLQLWYLFQSLGTFKVIHLNIPDFIYPITHGELHGHVDDGRDHADSAGIPQDGNRCLTTPLGCKMWK